MSTVTFRHESSRMEEGSKGKHLVKENITDGEKGLSIMFLKKDGEDFYKIYLKEDKESGKYIGDETKGDVKKDMNISESEFKKMVNANKNLNFVKEYLENTKGKKSSSSEKKATKKITGGEKKASKKSSKKKTEKKTEVSNKMSGGSKKSTKKSTKKTTKKKSGSNKKASKKVTKKKSKKY